MNHARNRHHIPPFKLNWYHPLAIWRLDRGSKKVHDLGCKNCMHESSKCLYFLDKFILNFKSHVEESNSLKTFDYVSDKSNMSLTCMCPTSVLCHLLRFLQTNCMTISMGQQWIAKGKNDRNDRNKTCLGHMMNDFW